MTIKGKKWVVRPQDPERAETLARSLETTPLVGQILLNRDLDDPARASEFLNCHLGNLTDPFLLNGMNEAVDRIEKALKQG